jgi:hypothetical protein
MKTAGLIQFMVSVLRLSSLLNTNSYFSLTETFPEYQSKKKALLELHRWFQGTKTSHFYDPVEVE